MNKLVLSKPIFIMLYGYPGSGKTFFARQFCEDIKAAHIQSDRIRYELFERPQFDRQENDVINQIMIYMAEEFLAIGMSVVFDTNSMRMGDRRILRDIARKSKAQPLLVWLQVDIESAFSRVIKRDRRKSDDKYAVPIDRTTFESIAGYMQNPDTTEDYIVISGKHTYQSQRSAVVKKLYDMGVVSANSASSNVVMPGLVNLIPKPLGGRVDNTRRNLTIR